MHQEADLSRVLSIIHVVRQFYPSTGGMEDVVKNIALAQIREGHSVRIITLDRLFRSGTTLPQTANVDGIPVLRIPFTGSERYPIAPTISRHLGSAHIIHVHGIDFFFDYFALRTLLPNFDSKLVASTHGGFFHTRFASRQKIAYLHTITRLSATRYNRIFASSEADAEIFAKVVSRSRLVTVENGVDITKFRGCASRSKSKSIISIGRWSANKRVFKTIDLLKQIHEKDKTWTLTLCGRPFDISEGEIVEYVAKQGLMTSVTVKADQSDDELRHEIGKASYFLSLSSHEGFGLAAVEAMSAGLIPLLSDIAPYRKLCAQFPDNQVMTLQNDSAQAADTVLRLHQLSLVDFTNIVTSASTIADSYGWRAASQRFMQEYMQLFS